MVVSSRFNYAAFDAGAKLLATSPSMKKATSILVADDDRYMMVPCSEEYKWFVIQLSEDILVDTFEIANFEHYSSSVSLFQLLGSSSHPTDSWVLLGTFSAHDAHANQVFTLEQPESARYIKFRWLSTYKNEYYCTLTYLRIYGQTILEEFRDSLEESEKEVREITAPFLQPQQQTVVVNGNGNGNGHVLPSPTHLVLEELIDLYVDSDLAATIPASVSVTVEHPNDTIDEETTKGVNELRAAIEGAGVGEDSRKESNHRNEPSTDKVESMSTTGTHSSSHTVPQTETPSASSSSDVISSNDSTASESSQPQVTKEPGANSTSTVIADNAATHNEPVVNATDSYLASNDTIAASSNSTVNNSASTDEKFAFPRTFLWAQLKRLGLQAGAESQKEAQETRSRMEQALAAAEQAKAVHSDISTGSGGSETIPGLHSSISPSSSSVSHLSSSPPSTIPSSSAPPSSSSTPVSYPDVSSTYKKSSSSSSSQSIFKALTNRIKDLEIHQALSTHFVSDLNDQFTAKISELQKGMEEMKVEFTEQRTIWRDWKEKERDRNTEWRTKMLRDINESQSKNDETVSQMRTALNESQYFLSVIETFVQLQLFAFVFLILMWLLRRFWSRLKNPSNWCCCRAGRWCCKLSLKGVCSAMVPSCCRRQPKKEEAVAVNLVSASDSEHDGSNEKQFSRSSNGVRHHRSSSTSAVVPRLYRQPSKLPRHHSSQTLIPNQNSNHRSPRHRRSTASSYSPSPSRSRSPSHPNPPSHSYPHRSRSARPYSQTPSSYSSHRVNSHSSSKRLHYRQEPRSASSSNRTKSENDYTSGSSGEQDNEKWPQSEDTVSGEGELDSNRDMNKDGRSEQTSEVEYEDQSSHDYDNGITTEEPDADFEPEPERPRQQHLRHRHHAASEYDQSASRTRSNSYNTKISRNNSQRVREREGVRERDRGKKGERETRDETERHHTASPSNSRRQPVDGYNYRTNHVSRPPRVVHSHSGASHPSSVSTYHTSTSRRYYGGHDGQAEFEEVKHEYGIQAQDQTSLPVPIPIRPDQISSEYNPLRSVPNSLPLMLASVDSVPNVSNYSLPASALPLAVAFPLSVPSVRAPSRSPFSSNSSSSSSSTSSSSLSSSSSLPLIPVIPVLLPNLTKSPAQISQFETQQRQTEYEGQNETKSPSSPHLNSDPATLHRSVSASIPRSVSSLASVSSSSGSSQSSSLTQNLFKDSDTETSSATSGSSVASPNRWFQPSSLPFRRAFTSSP